jgi:hypothetical protein
VIKFSINLNTCYLLDVLVYKCSTCPQRRLQDSLPVLCEQAGHIVSKVSAIKRFFECGQCRKREFTLTEKAAATTKLVLPPEIRCQKCGSFRWFACGMRGSGPLAVSQLDRLQNRPSSSSSSSGGGAVGGVGGGLLLTASEWTSRGEKVSMAEKVSRL